MASNKIEVDAVAAMRYFNMTVTFRRTRELNVRSWLARKLIRLAAWIVNCNIEIKDEP